MAKFLSTLPMRGATLLPWFNIISIEISIHAPHAGSDPYPSVPLPYLLHFYPRSPCGERPFKARAAGNAYQISIHAPHAGSDHITP